MVLVASQSHHSGIERDLTSTATTNSSAGPNRTTVGLKGASPPLWRDSQTCPNRTTVGLKGGSR